jgi:hypothetical protein
MDMNGTWRKSSYSNPNGNNCVEVTWRKSSYSNPNNAYVEVAAGSTTVGLRDSKNPDGPTLAFAHAHWSEFLAQATWSITCSRASA